MLDAYSIFGVTFMAILMCWHAIIGYYYKYWSTDADWIALIVAASIFVIVHIVLIIYHILVNYGPRRKYLQLQKDYKQMIDDKSKII